MGLLEIAIIVFISTSAFLLTRLLYGIFTYENKRKKEEMLTNQEIAASDRFVKIVIWALNIQIPILMIVFPFIFWSWSALYKYYLFGIFCYAIIGLILAWRSLPKLKLNIRAMRLGLTPVVVLVAIVWPLSLLSWRKLKGGVPEYERIKYIHKTKVK